MKKDIIFIIAIMISAGIKAQSLWDVSKPNSDFTYKVIVGLNVSSTDGYDAGAVRSGYHIGGMIDWNVVKSFSVSSGLELTNKGFHSGRGRANLTYLQIPILASYRLEAPTGVCFHFNIGPYFAYGLGGTIDFQPQDFNIYYDFNQECFGENGFFKHFDAGFAASAFIILGHIQLGVGYEYGMVDIAKVYGKFHNRNVKVTLGYSF